MVKGKEGEVMFDVLMMGRGDEMSSGGERGRGHCVLSEGGNDRTGTRTHLEATGLVTAGGFPIQVSQPWETARVSSPAAICALILTAST